MMESIARADHIKPGIAVVVEVVEEQAAEHAKGGDFRTDGEEAGNWRWCALINVWRPHMEWDSAEFISKPGEEEQNADDHECSVGEGVDVHGHSGARWCP